MTDDRIVDLEIRLAHQERLIEQLNEVLTDQQTRLTRLEVVSENLKDRVRAIGDGGADAITPEDERPPHY
ncbi:MAG: SlyX family protein [Pseudomonadota bacterium]